nr:transporter substrate-binding domain-containing protein [Desulfovibrio sp. Huiquan2017]
MVSTEIWPPFRLLDDKGNLSGFDVELLSLIGNETGLIFKWQQRPWPRVLDELEAGESDMTTGIAINDSRKKYLVYTDSSYFSCSPKFYVLKRNQIRIRKYVDLTPLRIGVSRNSVYFPKFDEDNTLQKMLGHSEEHLIRMVLAGRWDAFVGTDCQVLYDLKRLELSSAIVEAEYDPGKTTKLYFAVSKKSPLLVKMNELNAALEKFIRNGTVKKLAEKYFGK